MGADQPAAARAPSFSLNFDEAIGAIFRDPDWLKKLALGAFFSFLTLFVVGAFFIQGYLLTFGERVARAESRPLPEWDDFGELLRRGAIGIVVAIVYALPLLGVGVLVGLLLIPLVVIASAPGANADATGGIFAFGLCGGLAVLVPLALVVGVVVPAAHAQLILHQQDLAAALRFGEVLGFIRRHRGQYALMMFFALAANYGLSLIGQCACYVGIFVPAFVAQLFQYHLLGQLCWYERLALDRRSVAP
jgi:hypothetical protein